MMLFIIRYVKASNVLEKDFFLITNVAFRKSYTYLYSTSDRTATCVQGKPPMKLEAALCQQFGRYMHWYPFPDRLSIDGFSYSQVIDDETYKNGVDDEIQLELQRSWCI